MIAPDGGSIDSWKTAQSNWACCFFLAVTRSLSADGVIAVRSEVRARVTSVFPYSLATYKKLHNLRDKPSCRLATR